MLPSPAPRNLEEVLVQGPMPVPQALGYAIRLAEAIRRLHSAGQFHGSLTPSSVLLDGAEVSLAPPSGEPTPYASPEQLEGGPATAAADVFAFGAIVYQLVTGQVPCADAAPVGQPELDRILGNCLAGNASIRSQKVQQVLMELRLLATSLHRQESRVAQRYKDLETALRAELQQMDAALAARLEQQEQATLAALAASREEALAGIQSACDALQQLRQTCEQLTARLSAADERANRSEQISDETYREVMQAQGTLSAEVAQVKELVAAQAHVVETAKTSMSRTDDLVERVVEALDALQSMVLERVESQAA